MLNEAIQQRVSSLNNNSYEKNIDNYENANGFNFEMWSGECESISPALQMRRAADTIAYGKLKNEENIIVYENHPQDSRIKNMGEACQTISTRMGTGGGNLPIVQHCYSMAFEPGIAQREGGDSRFTEEFVGTLRSNAGDNQHAVAIKTECFNIAFCDANGTRKDRPNGGCYITDADSSKTISTSGLNETVIVNHEVISIDGDKIGKKERKGGSGFGINEENVMYTQTAKDVHAVAYEKNDRYFVRNLMPLECERLMGFTDNYTQISWRGKNPEDCPDAPRYKACGNSMCVNVMQWLGKRIDDVEKKRKINLKN